MNEIGKKRILIIGISGTGKSTIARKLSEISKIPVFHLDTCIWKENWTEAPQKEAEGNIGKILTLDQWIIEGFISPCTREKLECADIVVYLDYSGLRAAIGVLRRWLQYRGRVRPEMPQGCVERFDWQFLKMVLERKERQEIEDVITSYQNKILRLKSPRETNKFLSDLRKLGIL